MKRAVAYARYSSAGQRDESIDAQLRAINEFAAANDYNIVAKYIDRAQSARSDDRPQFQNMIEDSGKGVFETVIVHKLDRFSRDRFDSAVYRRKLRINGVKLISVLERLDGSPESVILESVIDGMAEYYSKNLSREVKKGMRENAVKARHNGGIPPLGYTINDRQEYDIEPSEADTVRRIFDMYSAGCSYGDIIDEMNRLGRMTKRGKSFWKNSLYEILRNEKYTGVYIYNRRYKSHINGKYNMHKRKDESEIVRIPDAVPRIIDDITWKKVQDRMNSHVHGEQKAIESYLLSGVIYCGNCGQRMNGNRRKSGHGDQQTYYISYKCSKNCGGRGVRRDTIEEAVLNDMQKTLFTFSSAEKIADSIEKYAAQMNHDLNDKIKETQSLYREADKRVKSLVDAVSNGMYRPEMNEQIERWGDRKDALAEELNELQSRQGATATATRENIVSYLIQQGPLMELPTEKRKSAIKRFVESVTIQADRAEIKYKLNSGPAVLVNGLGEPHLSINTTLKI